MVQVTVVVPTGKLLGALLLTSSMLQLSDTVGCPSSTSSAESSSASILMVMFAGAVISGSSSSTTITVCSAVASLPLTSITVHITVFVPKGKTSGALLLNDRTSQLSETSGSPRSISPDSQPLVTVRVLTVGGAMMVGSSLSTTVTVCTAVSVLPLPSTTVHITLVVPTG